MTKQPSLCPAESILIELTNPDRLYREYSVEDYIEYCHRIRAAVKDVSERPVDRRLASLFEKQFVEELEAIAAIAKHHLKNGYAGARVQCLERDPPDGIITLPDGQNIAIECTCAIDHRWESFVLEQWREHKRLFSLTGFDGTDIAGNRNTGYTVRGMRVDDPANAEFFVEAEEQSETIKRHRQHIARRIENKLQSRWHSGTNWLSIFVNEMVMVGGYSCMQPTLEELCREYADRLRERQVAGVYFVGNRCSDDGWISFHPTPT